MKNYIKKLFLLAAVFCGLTSFAAEWRGYTYGTGTGNEISCPGASSVTVVDGALIIQYTSTTETKSLTLSADATAEYLVVGGGGSGGCGKDSTGGGGNGGTVKHKDAQSLAKNVAYAVTVGAGGKAVSGNKAAGAAGSASKIVGGGLTVEAAGGAGGKGSDVAAPGTTSDNNTYSIGPATKYGQGGAGSGAADGADNTGNGGGSAAKNKTSGAGGSGVVVIRITDITRKTVALPARSTPVGVRGTISELQDVAGNWTATAYPTGKIEFNGSGTSTLSFKGLEAGETTLTIETDYVTYTCIITVTKEVVPLDPVSVEIGHSETITGGFSTKTWTGAATSSSSGKISFDTNQRTGDLVVHGLVAGDTIVTIDTPDTTYTCAVTVTKPTVVLTAQTFYVGDSVEIPSAGFSSSTWTATAPPNNIVSLSATKGPGTLTVTGQNAGSGTLTIENDTTIYTCALTVNTKPTKALDQITIRVGKTANITGEYSSLSWNNATVTQTGIVNLSQLSGPGEITVTGANPGQTTVRINTPEVLYTCLVTVEAKPTVTLPAARINTGATYEIPGDYSSVAWTATANPTGKATLSRASGAAGQTLSVTGASEGSTRITIVTDDVDYLCDITVGTIDYSNYRTVTAGGDPRAIQLFFWDGINTRGFSWQTDGTTIKTGAVTIVPGNVVGNPSAFNGADATTYNATASGHTDCYTYTAHTGTLQPGVYSYRLGTTDHYAYGTFTVTTGDDPLTIFNFSDIQMRYADDLHLWQEAVSAADQALGGGRNADLILTIGDIYAETTPSGSSSYLKWGVTMDNMRPAFADVPFMMANGNHDTDYYTANLAENWSSGCFSVDYGDVHIATIPYPGSDNNLSTTVSNWLKNDLNAASDAKWKIVAMHNGPYTTGDHGWGASETYVKAIAAIMTTYKVDLVIQAHDHTYTKTLPYLWSGDGYTTTEDNAAAINLKPETATINGKEYYINPEGTVYICDASAGDRTGEQITGTYKYALRGATSRSYDNRTYKVITDKINVNSSYRNIGDDGSYDIARPMFGVLEVNGNLLDYSWYVAESDGSATLFDTLHLSKKMMETIGTNVVVVGESMTIPYDERWGDSWTVSGSSKVQAEKVGNNIVITGLAEGETSVAVSVDMTDYVYTTYVVRQPYPVAFCQGDNVQIWYHNTAKKNWFLLINQERFEVNDDNSRGDQMKVKLFASNPNTDSYIVGTAETVGDPESPDLVVISDGENFYSYRMSVAAPRRVGVGESVSMTCSTVAENVWTAHAEEDSADYISVTCDSDGTPNHSTTATITGLVPAEETWAIVSDQKHDEGEVNAQGAIYRLKTQVYGAANVKVHLSAGVSMDVAGGYFNATATTQYRVVVSNEFDVVTADNLTFVLKEGEAGGYGFVGTITADPAGQSGMTTDGGDRRCFVVQASNDGTTWEDVFRYIVNVTYSFSFEAGITVPGFLYGAPTPWITRSSDPSIVEVSPTRYRDMYSAQAKSLRSGDCVFISTNTTLSADYWGIKAKVYEVNVVDVDMPFNSTTNFTVACDGRYLGPWSVHQGTGTGRVSADISTTEPVQSTEVTFTSTGVKGQSIVEVSNGYHVDRFRIYVSDGTKPIVRGNTAIRVVSGGTVTLPSEMYRTAWTAVSEDSSIASVSASGAAGQPIVVTGVAVGRTGPTGAAQDFTYVTIESDDAIYVAKIEVVAASEYLPPIEVGVGEAKTFPLDGPLATAIMGAAQDGTLTIDNVTIDPVGKTYTVIGRQEGQTAIAFTLADGHKYLVPVTVHERHIDKRVNLVIGGQGTSSYSYTFDAITAISNASPDHVAISQNGNTLTFTPLLTGKDAQIYVYCFVDGLHESSVLHYWFDISALDDQSLKIWQLSDRDQANGAGYIGYKGESDIYEDPASGDLVMVFTNTDVNGLFVIPEDFMARVDILAVGGGGAGGSSDRFGYGAGGGGAGGLTYVTNRYFESGTFSISVGQGGSVTGTSGAAPGLAGEGSFVTNSFGYIFASATGGGGGGAPAAHMTGGNPGGSGGGAAWFDGEPGDGGRGIDGQGARGGKPSEVNSGAGGGGAGSAGGADSSAGAGRSIGITGENVLYSQGGKGAKSDQTAAAADGAGPGFGGDGGNAGPGGAGADGAVVVRITSLKTTVLVPVPTTNDLITSRFEWADGKVCKPFAYEGQTFRGSDAHPYTWDEVIDHIDGTYVVNCSLGPDGETKEGVGYYTYTVYLKDGFAWDDGKASINGKRFMWTVTESLENVDAVLEVHKTVTWVNSSNATVTVTTKSSPEISGGGTPNVLFLGSLCSRHGLSDETVERVMSTMVSKANVDWFFYNNAQANFGNTTPHSSGHFDQGADVTGLPTLSTSTHHNLLAYLTLLDERLNPASGYKYDYIVIEFDSDRLFEHIPEYDSQAAALTDRVARYLKPYYENKSVIWVVDDWAVQEENPWGGEDGFWWTPSTWNKDNPRYPVNDKWNFEVALLDPVLYLSKDNGERYATTASNGGYTYYFANRNEAQATYNYPDDVLAMLNSTIKVKPFNLFYKDKIVSPAQGLSITGVTVLWCTNEVDGAASENDSDWKPMLDWDAATQQVTFHDDCGVKGASMEVNLVSNLVTAVISNVDVMGWARCETHVVDDGTFRTSEGATYNQKTGRYEKNPNDGDAYVGMVDDYGVSVGVDGSATTETEWDFVAYPVQGTAVNGSIFVNGGIVNPVSVYEGSSVPVYYRGFGGYKLDSILVDNVKVDITDDNIACYVFENLDAGHSVDVTYVSVIGDVSSEPVTTNYDGDVHLYPVTLTGWDEEYDYEVRYALSADTPTDEYMSEAEFRQWCATNAEAKAANAAVGEHVYWFRVFAFQPGYGATLNDPGWVWVDTGMGSSDTVTIEPRDLVVHPEYYHVESFGDPFPNDVGYEIEGFVDGEDASALGDISAWHVHSDYEAGDDVGQYETYMDGVTDGDPVGNYRIILQKGVLDVVKKAIEIGGVPQSSRLDPEDPYTDTGVDRVVKPYDGIATNLTVNVTEPTSGYTIHYRTGDDGAWTTTNPTFDHAGTNKVWYAVEEPNNHFAATNYQYVIILPLELTLRSADAEKQYDTTELVKHVVEVVGGSFHGDEGFDYTFTGTQTEVGSSDNAFTCVQNDKTQITDYVITKEYGTLTVTPAPIVIGDVEQPLDPNKPLDQDHNGVESVTVPYTGEGTNITVNVTLMGDDEATILFTTNRSDATSWSEDPIFLTNACRQVVYFEVESPNYVAVTNFALITITPRTVTVTADDKSMQEGGEYPEFTFTAAIESADPQLTAEARAKIEAEVATALAGDAFSATVGSGDDEAGYPIIPTGPKTMDGGNFNVVYVNGLLSVVDSPVVTGLWITDHADAGAGKIHLAVQPTISAPLTAAFVLQLASENRIKVAFASTVEGLATAEKTTAVLRDATGALDVDKGWIWITITPTLPLTGPLYWKVFIDEPSANVFAMVEVAAPKYGAVIIPIPWCGYTADGAATLDERIDHLVWPYGLADDDLVLACTSDVTYAAWSLEGVANDASGARQWTPMTTIAKGDPTGLGGTLSGIIAENDGTGTIPRGTGMWLVQKGSSTNSFVLVGQYTSGPATVTVPGVTTAAPTCCVMLANPLATEGLDINSIAWPAGQIGKDDSVIVTTGSNKTKYYMWDADKGKWYYGQTSISGGAIKTTYVYDLDPLPAGCGFWYVRRGSSQITVTIGK